MTPPAGRLVLVRHGQTEWSRDGRHTGLSDLEVTFTVRFPEGEDGDRARQALPRAVVQSRDRLCTVSRTVQLGTPIDMRAEDPNGG